MIRSGLIAVPAAALLIASAGLAQQGAQPGMQPGQQDRGRQLDREQIEQRPLLGERPATGQKQPWGKVARGGDIIGSTVLDSNNDNIGSINDLVLEPQTGHVAYAIISHGGFLGIGAEHVAVPWQVLQARPDQDRTYQVNITQERLEQAPSFEEDRWPLLERPGWFDSTDEFFGTTRRTQGWGTGGWGMQGRLQQDWDQGEETTIHGTITNIERKAPKEGMEEGLVVSIQTADGQDRLVHLGPAWYLEGQVAELQDGQQVHIKAREIAIEDRVVVLAKSVQLEQGALALRDEQGRPVWDAMARDQRGILAVPERDFDRDMDDRGLDRPHDPARPGMDPDQPGLEPRRDVDRRPHMQDPHMQDPHLGTKQAQTFIRASDVRGKTVRSFEQENIGTVNELAVDINTGRVPFVIAGFGGFLGMGETEVVLPWQSITFLTHESKFMLAIDEQLLRTAPQLERDQLHRLEDSTFRQEVYSHFRMDPGFATYEYGEMPGMEQRQPWAVGGQLQEQFTQGQEIEIRGTVTNVGRGEISPGTAEAVVVNVRDRQGQEHTVKLGPAWFLQRQDLMVRAGEEIGIEGRQIEIEGRQMILAETVRTVHAGLRLRDEQGQPRWDALQRDRHLAIPEQDDDDDELHQPMPEPEEPGQRGDY
jgi:sporulation protein YlmC with PRC-barrel domain